MSSTTLVRRPPRRPAPPFPHGEFPLQEPPSLPESQGGQVSTLLMYLPMAAASGVMMLMFIAPGRSGRIIGYLGAGMMVIAMAAMGVAQIFRVAGERKLKLKGERRDYLRYLGQVRKRVRKAIDSQRESMLWIHPDPDKLWAIVSSDRLWERRGTHADFCEVRIGRGPQQLALRLQAPQTQPVEDLEPLCASALRKFLRAYTTVEDLPMAVYLRSFARVSLRPVADEPAEAPTGRYTPHPRPGDARGMARALVAQLAAFHSPDDVRIAVCASPDRMADWDWVKWLPHALHRTEHDAAGPVRMVAGSWGELESLLGEEFTERSRFDPAATPSVNDPYVLIVLDGVPQPERSRPATAGYRNTTIVDVGADSLPWKDHKLALRLQLTPDRLEMVSADRAGVDQKRVIGKPDRFHLARAATFARRLAPFRSGRASGEATDLATTEIELTQLLGAGDARSVTAEQLWQRRSPWDYLRVPIGVTDRGAPVELDIKESAQGGMGPHGILIGATGSGKSELLRTLVLSLAMTHSSEVLNLVLVDFKGGATFAGLDQLPHVSAFITNLADELSLVDRMQDALHGELVRRQEALRASGYKSAHDYEKARADGAELEPFPTLFVVVDEFGELLSSKSEFMNLFLMIGRLGRSLGVHLLLASQRLEEGRISALETHLSYRMGLRMFSSMESRSVIGTPDAYDQPLPPGTGFLRTDTTTLVKFKAAYVSGECKSNTLVTPHRVIEGQVVPYGVSYLAPLTPLEADESADEPQEDADKETVLNVVVDRLRGQGPNARPIWLPPLEESPSLGDMLGEFVTDPKRGFGVPLANGAGQLRVPVGEDDRPFEQRRDPMVADLSGGAGHVGIVSGPQMGKSTLVRTLVSALALTHTPEEVQFYLLDFGGGSLSVLSALPHVGSIASRLDKDRVNRTVSEIVGVLEWREQRFGELGVDSIGTYRRLRRTGEVTDDPYGDIFLVIDGWFTLHQEFDGLEKQIQDIVARGLNYGIHVVVTASRWAEFRPWLRDLLGTRFELRLGDPIDSEMDYRKAKEVPTVPGRGLTSEKFQCLTGLPRIDDAYDAGVGEERLTEVTAEDNAEANRALCQAIAAAWHGAGAPAVRMLPLALEPAALPPVPQDGYDLRIPLGIDELRLEPVWHDFGTTPHLVVFGEAETGKTNMLRWVAKGITERFSPAEARVIFGDSRRELHAAVPAEYTLGYAVSGSSLREMAQQAAGVLKGRVPASDVPPDKLAAKDWWTGPQLFMLLDDYELLSPGAMQTPLDPLLELAAQGAEIGLHLVVARSSTGAMRSSNDPLLRRLLENTSPAIVLSTPKEEGAFVQGVRGRALPPGRAQFSNRRRVLQLIQTVRLPDPGAGTARHDHRRRIPASTTESPAPHLRTERRRDDNDFREGETTVSSAVATDLCRVVVVTPKSSAELAIPAGVAVGDLLPALVHHSGAAEEGTPEYDKGWILQRLGEPPLDENSTPAALRIREGETLYLRTADTQLPASHFDDLIDGVATGVGNRPDRWGAEATRWVFRAIVGGILLLGLWLSWTGPLLIHGATTAVVAMLLLVGAAAASRALGDRPGALVLAIGALPYAAVSGLVVPMLPGGAVLTGPSVLCAAVAVTLTALMGMAAVGTDEVVFASLAVAAAGGVVGAGMVVFVELPGSEAAAIMLGVTLVISVFAPTTAFRLARLKLPMLPTGPEDLSKNIEPIPGPALIEQAAIADRYLTGMFLAVGFISLGCVTIIGRSTGWLPISLCLTTAAILLLRSRGLISTWQRLSAIVPAGYSVALLVVGAANRADWVARLGMLLLPALAAAVLAVIFSRTLPGRRIHPLWGRIGDILEWLAAIAMIPLVLALIGVFGWARSIAG